MSERALRARSDHTYLVWVKHSSVIFSSNFNFSDAFYFSREILCAVRVL